MRWAQATHDWLEKLWQSPEGGTLGKNSPNTLVTPKIWGETQFLIFAQSLIYVLYFLQVAD